jgi:hypothetical protein
MFPMNGLYKTSFNYLSNVWLGEKKKEIRVIRVIRA